MNKKELDKILKEHYKWLHDNDGSHADLSRADLRGADLSRADLRGADLSCADLRGADLRDADLSCADLRDADLRDADLRGADLRGADLRGADLRGADLSRADLRDADLRGAYLSCADLRGADLSCADLRDVDELILSQLLIVPEEGQFTAWKKIEGCLIKLQVPSKAKRLNSYSSRKCRVEFAKVLSITSLETNQKLKSVKGGYKHDFTYIVGEIAIPDSFDEDKRVECSHGIHCFITKEEAIRY